MNLQIGSVALTCQCPLWLEACTVRYEGLFQKWTSWAEAQESGVRRPEGGDSLRNYTLENAVTALRSLAAYDSALRPTDGLWPRPDYRPSGIMKPAIRECAGAN